MSGFLVVFNGSNTDSAWSDSTGVYTLDAVSPGQGGVFLSPPPSWEQVTPILQNGYSEDIQTYQTAYRGRDFGVHILPRRSRLSSTG